MGEKIKKIKILCNSKNMFKKENEFSAYFVKDEVDDIYVVFL